MSRVTVTGATKKKKKADNTEGDKKADAKVIGPENVTSSYLVLSGTHFRGGRQLGEYTIKSVRARAALARLARRSLKYDRSSIARASPGTAG